ncbi:Fe-S cluster assembly protein SufD [Marinobacter sp. LV10MA510-1]|uniref:Fe-S cluster assembly protein SufD n=1 Tax=Marinobacter sp. LV10MA510-1 TaxID=1415567 RepID=UPI000BF27217|nr:Fe-S cluster assembly protein SufD [Marinobacter sp. LV10MA510-1]PFG11304.1 Iron-regulated ABC transporter permease protein SufD [Marinobacter sp. LV10MA510-1]
MKSASTLSSAFLQSAGQALPEPLLALRANRASALKDLLLPTRKTENWKYSAKHLKLTDEMASSLPLSASAGAEADIQGYTVVLVNGVVRPEASNYPALEGLSIKRFSDLNGDDAELAADLLGKSISDQPAKHGSINLSLLNAARFEDGLLIQLQPGTVLDQPLFVIHHTSASHSGSAFPCILVAAGSNSQLTLVEDYVSSGESPVMVNTATEFSLGDGANVTSVRLNTEGQNVQHIGTTGVRQQRNSRFASHSVGFGGTLRRHDLHVRLEGEGAECKLNGVVVTQGTQHYDNHTTIEHIAAHCNSEESYRNIAADKSHAIFNGRIHIHQDAQKSNANMSNKNLLLTNGAEIDTKPELEIYADDVKCAHGATIGQLDNESIFYLVSRGLSPRDAKVLLTMAFINELVAQIPVEQVRDTANTGLNQFFDQAFQEV